MLGVISLFNCSHSVMISHFYFNMCSSNYEDSGVTFHMTIEHLGFLFREVLIKSLTTCDIGIWEDIFGLHLQLLPQSSWNFYNFLLVKCLINWSSLISFILVGSIFSSNIWSLTPVPDTEILNSLKCSRWQQCLLSNEMTADGPLDGGYSPEMCDTAMVRCLELSALPPILQEGKRAWRWS